jgi:hypothetical protein
VHSGQHVIVPKNTQASVDAARRPGLLSTESNVSLDLPSAPRSSYTNLNDGPDTPRPGQTFKLDGHSSTASRNERSATKTKASDVDVDMKMDIKTHTRARHSSATVGSAADHARRPSTVSPKSSSGSMLPGADMSSSPHGKENIRDPKISSSTVRDRRPSVIDKDEARVSIISLESVVSIDPRSLEIYNARYRLSSSTDESSTADITTTSVASSTTIRVCHLFRSSPSSSSLTHFLVGCCSLKHAPRFVCCLQRACSLVVLPEDIGRGAEH